jgi:hypothetical protein
MWMTGVAVRWSRLSRELWSSWHWSWPGPGGVPIGPYVYLDRLRLISADHFWLSESRWMVYVANCQERRSLSHPLTPLMIATIFPLGQNPSKYRKISSSSTRCAI